MRRKLSKAHGTSERSYNVKYAFARVEDGQITKDDEYHTKEFAFDPKSHMEWLNSLQQERYMIRSLCVCV